MALLGKAAMVLSFDVAAAAIDEHDDWHTHEHFPERLSIPGFLRGTRWIAQQGSIAKVRPDQKVVLIRDWENIEERLRGLAATMIVMARLASEGTKAAA